MRLKALSEYKTIQDVFTRKLKEGARDIESSVVSPADGTLSQSAKANNDTAVQAKGLTYLLKNLVYGENSLGKSDFEDISSFIWLHIIIIEFTAPFLVILLV